MSDYLPGGIILEILRRLPIKSVIHCCLVCRSWKSLIESSTHLRRKVQPNNQNEPYFLLLKPPSQSLNWSLWDLGEYITIENPYRHLTESVFPRNENKIIVNNFNVVGTCNGLVCFAFDFKYYGSTAVIWNPSIRKYVSLPWRRISNPKNGSVFNIASYAFGYDSRTKDYKVLRTVSDFGRETEVWSLARGTWKILRRPKDFPSRGDNVRYAFVNGAVHWVHHRRRDQKDDAIVDTSIVLFDMSTELYRETRMMPEDLRGKQCHISRYMESIGLFTGTVLESNKSSIDVCVMRDYGAVQSWTKLFTLPTYLEGTELEPFGFKKNGGEAVFKMSGTGERVITVDLKTKKVGEFAINDEYKYYDFLDCFAESLALLGHVKSF
ncbi:PREDICTED: F-box/kelch-repeat protein At3g23880-like [Fragaria vesca subsp. vesca]|uniref:F-box/kelch-repeat protein At3g23880-like n=1 Tax=Fragaria vesca subsp. vesca TaxID=101020 RepID=UPI0002C3719E|nr:PREDICTED: F-box/kelch-repeat protein At3g23880-like [Fragaria vesca subsp. vesca]